VAKEFPTAEITSTYLNASSSIRDLRARVVTLVVPVECLKQGAQSKEKFIRLVGDRYNPVTDSVTIVTDSCPYQKQNRDYAEYLLTALFHESAKREEWEERKTEKDMVSYSWSIRPTRSESQNHLQSVQVLLNEGESKQSLAIYKKAVEELVGVAPSA
jgi:small subunit ribosomal protein S35